MKRMGKKERILAAINKQDVDRIPYGMWSHFPQVDQDPVQLAEVQIALARAYDLDFIKMTPYGNYSAHDFGLSVTFYCTPEQPAFERKFGIEDPSEWANLKALPGDFGSHGKQVLFARQLQKQLKGEEIPYIQTLFSPLTTAKKLAGPRLFEDMRSHPEEVHQALKAITETTINFIKLNIEAGVAGFFLAVQCANTAWVTEEEFDEFGVPYDLQVIEAFKDQTYFNVVHLHGENTMFEKVAAYPVQCINWHDRWVSPTMAEARKISDKCFLGGINERWLITAKPEEILGHMQEAVASSGRNGVMFTPGCVAELNTPQINFYALRTAIEQL